MSAQTSNRTDSIATIGTARTVVVALACDGFSAFAAVVWVLAFNVQLAGIPEESGHRDYDQFVAVIAVLAVLTLVVLLAAASGAVLGGIGLRRRVPTRGRAAAVVVGSALLLVGVAMMLMTMSAGVGGGWDG